MLEIQKLCCKRSTHFRSSGSQKAQKRKEDPFALITGCYKDVEETAVGITFSDILFFVMAYACELMLPVVHQPYDEFKKDVTFAFLNTRGYGYA